MGFTVTRAGYLQEEPGTFLVVRAVLAVTLPATPALMLIAPVAPTEIWGFKSCQLPVLWVFWW